MKELLSKYQRLSPETQQQVDDFVDFMLVKDQQDKPFDIKDWKKKIESVNIWSEEDVAVFEVNRKWFNQWEKLEW